MNGLVLEGGAMRGMFTCGVLDVFMENNISFDGAVGISAGACFGCNIKSKQPQRALRYNLKYGTDPRYMSVRSLLKTGDLYGAKFCYHTIPKDLDPLDFDTFKNNPMKFYAGATDVETGKIVFHEFTDMNDTDIEWMRASASMPLVSRIVEVGKYKLLDGGITASVPLAFMQKLGYEKNVVVMTQPEGYIKEKNPTMPIARIVLRKYPKLIAAMSKRHIVYNKEVGIANEAEKAGNAFIIRPECSLGIKRTENRPEELIRVYELGRNAALLRLDELKKFLGAV